LELPPGLLTAVILSLSKDEREFTEPKDGLTDRSGVQLPPSFSFPPSLVTADILSLSKDEREFTEPKDGLTDRSGVQLPPSFSFPPSLVTAVILSLSKDQREFTEPKYGLTEKVESATPSQLYKGSKLNYQMQSLKNRAALFLCDSHQIGL
jgi:hypothetical protein